MRGKDIAVCRQKMRLLRLRMIMGRERTSSMCLKCFGGVLPKTIIGKYFGPLFRELQTPGLLNMPKLYR
ncbi:hypothetical protein L0P53_14025, partial [Holdemanella sp. DFI.5.21]|nr:hypothetical protein [Holdemanella sp. DFI.5.21]